MYQKSFFLEKNKGNNAFSYDIRKNKSLYVASIMNATFNDIALWDEIVFEDVDFDWVLQSCKGLESFYYIPWKWKEICLFDNHNHAYYFWWEYFLNSKKLPLDPPHLSTLAIAGADPEKWASAYTLIHIDEHSDMRDPWVYLDKSPSLEEVFDYTHNTVNVGNYIIPAIHDGLIEEDVIQIRDSQSLENYFELDLEGKKIILNLDLDFFEPALDFIDYELKKKVVLDAAERADIITVATSPFFIDQARAIEVFKDLFAPL